MNETEVQNHSAQYYTTRYSGYGLRYHRDLIHRLMAQAAGTILDAGCGTGIVSQLYPHKDITGIDLSDAMLARHPGRAYRMDVCQLPTLWKQRFDFILCRSLLHHLPDHVQGLSEMHRTLRSDGKIAFLETNHSAFATWVRQRTQHGDRFSAYHHSFVDTELLHDITKWFTIDAVHYEGFLQYPWFGFPDIIPLATYTPGNPLWYPLSGLLDRGLSHLPWIKRLSWAIRIHAHKV